MPEIPEIVFEEPPSDARRSPLTRWLDSLADHPGQWAKYPEPVNPGTAGNHQRVSAKRVEVARRGADAEGNAAPAGKCWLYARYIGGGE